MQSSFCVKKQTLASLIIAVIVVGGLLTYFVLSKSNQTSLIVLQNNNQTNINNQPSSINSFSSWQTYKNEALGFEIKYPNDWKVNPTDPEFINGKQYGVEITFQSNKLPSIYRLIITKLDNPLKLSAKELVNQSLKNEPPFRYESASDEAMGLYNAYVLHRVFAIDEYDESATIIVGDSAYRFIYPSPGNNPNVSESESLFLVVEKILSTFRSI
ncbi:MAG TPA: PsbP-related protein [Candidatus Paceibacterota bacterium]